MTSKVQHHTEKPAYVYIRQSTMGQRGGVRGSPTFGWRFVGRVDF